MSHTVFNWLKTMGLGALVAGCGLTQSVVETTTSASAALFYKQVTTLRLDFTGRAALNTDDTDMTGLSVPTLVRVYQLRDSQAMDRATYEAVLSDAGHLLHADLLDQRALVINPGAGAQLDVPLDKDARFVSVVALFRSPDTQAGTWRVTLPRDVLDPDRARVIELASNRLNLQPLARE